MKTVFLTGASGNMGRKGLEHLLARRVRVVALVLPTERDRAAMEPYLKDPNLRVVWGDLTHYDDVLSCVTGATHVLHVGGMVSPAADLRPALTTKVNLGAIRNILKAIKAQPDPDAIRLVYIGTIAETGHRNPPIHWGRVGDPIQISVYDNYAITKTIAEREVIDSGLKYWVSLRQTGLAHDNLGRYGGEEEAAIAFHQPLNGVFEWVTAEDSGRMLANACEDEVPERFWRNVYNIGGGPSCRIVNHEFMRRIMLAMTGKDFRKVYEPNWFATRNFHGQWYEDSDRLEEFLHFRGESLDDFIERQRRRVPAWQRLLMRLVPTSAIRKAMKKRAEGPGGTLGWIRDGDRHRISAFFGSLEAWKTIPGWDGYVLEQPSQTPRRLDHGYDESKPRETLDIADMRQAAAFRGGECLSEAMAPGDLAGRLHWRCAFGHEFEGSPTLVLLAGHWCPDCLPAPWNDDEIARRNPFLAQVRHVHCGPEESNFYPASILEERGG